MTVPTQPNPAPTPYPLPMPLLMTSSPLSSHLSPFCLSSSAPMCTIQVLLICGNDSRHKVLFYRKKKNAKIIFFSCMPFTKMTSAKKIAKHFLPRPPSNF